MSDSNIQKESLIFAGKQPEERHYHVRLQTGVYIVQNTMARGGGGKWPCLLGQPFYLSSGKVVTGVKDFKS